MPKEKKPCIKLFNGKADNLYCVVTERAKNSSDIEFAFWQLASIGGYEIHLRKVDDYYYVLRDMTYEERQDPVFMQTYGEYIEPDGNGGYTFTTQFKED